MSFRNKNVKLTTMKNVLFAALLAASVSACDNQSATTAETEDSTTVTATTPTTTTTYTPAEGDATYRDGKVMVWRNNDWVEADTDVTMDDGIVVYRSGEVKKEGKTVKLEDGEVVTHTGNFLDKTGEAISDAWDATKKGVSKAGEAIGDAADKTKDAVVGDSDEK